MADGDTDWYSSETSMTLETGIMNDDLQVSLIYQVGMMFTEAISFQKVRLNFDCTYRFLKNLALII